MALELVQEQAVVAFEVAEDNIFLGLGGVEPLDVGKCRPGDLPLGDNGPGDLFLFPVTPFEL